MRITFTCLIFLLHLSFLVAGDKSKPVQPSITLSQRIEQLLRTLQNDSKESNRAQAAEDLGELASPEYPEIVSGLIDALIRDTSSSVRKTIIRTLASIEPATHEVKEALDQAAKSDKSWPVRQVARMAAWRYKPRDEPPQVPEPQLRNSSKPGVRGWIPVKNRKPPEPPVDPLKSLPMPEVPVPAVPAIPALPQAPATKPKVTPKPGEITHPPIIDLPPWPDSIPRTTKD